MNQSNVDPANEHTQIDEHERRRKERVPIHIELNMSVYQWKQEGEFAGQMIRGYLKDISEGGAHIVSNFPLAQEMFVIIHLPKDSELPAITCKVIRVEPGERVAGNEDLFHYGCMMIGVSPVIQERLKLYIADQSKRT